MNSVQMTLSTIGRYLREKTSQYLHGTGTVQIIVISYTTQNGTLCTTMYVLVQMYYVQIVEWWESGTHCKKIIAYNFEWSLLYNLYCDLLI